MRLTYVRLLVSEFDACFRFYRDVLGFPVTWGQEGDGYASFATGEGAALSLFARDVMAGTVGTADLPATAPAQDRVALIFDVSDLDATVAALAAQGVVFVRGPQDHPEWGIRTAYLRDPDGTLIELAQNIPVAEWTPALQAEARQYETA